MSGFHLKLGLGFIGIVAALSLIYMFTYHPTEQKVKFPRCAQGQTAEFVILQPFDEHGGALATHFRRYHCEPNGKWKLTGAFYEGGEIGGEQP